MEPKIKQEGRVVANARVTVDYTKKKPSIKFAYPDKDEVKQNTGNPLISIIAFLIMIGMFSLMFFLPIFSGHHTQDPTQCNYTLNISNQIYKDANLTFINIECDNDFVQTIRWKHIESRLNFVEYLNSNSGFGWQAITITRTKQNVFAIVYLILMLVVFFGGLQYLDKYLTKLFLKFKWFRSAVPHINAAVTLSGFYAKFKKVPNCGYIEIPLFHNVELNYNAVKGFSDQLIKVEIKEHPFVDLTVKTRYPIFGKRKVKYKKNKNIWLWYARFYFKKIPKIGYLEVWFR